MAEYYTITPGYFENLPKKASASGVLFYNEAGELLVVKPNYKAGWGIPGGMLEEMEAPTLGAMREVQEELGLHKTAFTLLCVEYVQLENPTRDSFQFIFAGGVLTQDEINAIVLDANELDEFRFMKPEEAIPLLGKNVGPRVKNILEHTGSFPIYIEQKAIL